MLAAPIPENDDERLDTLRSLELLDTSAEERFDRVTRIACKMLNVPIALVSLVDANRQWFKSCVGLGASETPRDVSFCGHAIHQDTLFYIPDATKDVRFADNPLVTGPPHVIFYAGQPLSALNGQKMGTLCVIDSKPRELDERQKEIIRDLSKIVENEMNILKLNEALRIQRESERRISEVMDNVREGLFLITEEGRIGPRYSAALKGLLGRENLAGVDFSELMAELADDLDEAEGRAFIRVAFKRGKNERILRDLNPFACLKIADKFLDFDFAATLNEGKVQHLVCTAKDITSAVRLEQEIAAAEAKTAGMMEKLVGILHLDPEQLRDFLAMGRTDLERVEELARAYRQEQAPELVQDIQRHVHSIKGDAGLLGVKIVESTAHAFEDQLRVPGGDLKAVILEGTEKLSGTFTELEDLLERLGRLGDVLGTQDRQDLNVRAMSSLAAKLAGEKGRRAVLNSDQGPWNIPGVRDRRILRKIIVQLIRNSVAHGFHPDDHTTLNIHVSAGIVDGRLRFEYRDDGRGLQFDLLRRSAVRSGVLSEAEADGLDDTAAARLIFMPSVSTASQVDGLAGRGVGMDLVREEVRRAGGRLTISSRAGRGFRLKAEWTPAA